MRGQRQGGEGDAEDADVFAKAEMLGGDGGGDGEGDAGGAAGDGVAGDDEGAVLRFEQVGEAAEQAVDVEEHLLVGDAVFDEEGAGGEAEGEVAGGPAGDDFEPGGLLLGP